MVVVGEVRGALDQHAQIGLALPHGRRTNAHSLGLEQPGRADDMIDQLRQPESIQLVPELGQCGDRSSQPAVVGVGKTGWREREWLVAEGVAELVQL